MFDLQLFILLILISLPGTIIAIRHQMATLHPKLVAQDPKTPSLPILTSAALAQTLLILLAAAALGTSLGPTVGFDAPVLRAIAHVQSPLPHLKQQLPAFLIAILGALITLLLYYRVFRPWLSPQTVLATEQMRRDLGLPARILFGGIVEEIIFRWGLQTFIAWFGLQLVGQATSTVIWTAIILAGIAFGLGHLPGFVASGQPLTRPVIGTAILLNLFLAITCGWLLWQFGLFPAILTHALTHLFWWPLEQKYTPIP
ncbi:MAG TPA: CPBP family intramembrane glutamic endopeptidase [Anaerolineae bacterium]|nr:CPBP family intramembrane glutamic endopeptidase [Anaerolineae bacterium]